MKQRLIWLLALLAALAMPSLAWGEAAVDPEVDMLEVDHKLYELGYRDSACNGELDDVTINALRNFQAVNGLPVTGEADSQTVALLLSGQAISEQAYLTGIAQARSEQASLAEGSHGANVEKLQRALKGLGYFKGNCDGAYGEATAAAVYRFQLANGLMETGVADGAVLLRLYEGESVDWNGFLQGSCAAAGESGVHVRRIQQWLKNKGYFRGECTGRYGEATQQAVKRFQSASGLESSGDADYATCEALFTDVAAMRSEESALRRGSEGEAVAALCARLTELGYPAGGSFTMRTELGVMQFQLASGLSVSGIADAVTLAALNAEGARRAEEYAAPALDDYAGEGLQQQLLRMSGNCLGQQAGFADSLEFVEYLCLKCGIPLVKQSQLTAEAAAPEGEIPGGQILCVQAEGREIFGVTTSDRALVYCGENGYVVMRYLDVMQPEQIWTLTPGTAQ